MRRSSRLRGREDATEAPDTPAKRQKSDDNENLSAVQPAPSEHLSAWNAFLESKLFLKAPGDLYNVFELASELRPESPCEAFVDTLGLRLIGPFDLLAAATKKEVKVDKPLYLHGRFFFDPPEVVAAVVDTDGDEGRHWGYFRDAPDQVPEYIVCAEINRECKFDIVGSNLFQVLENRVQKRQSTLGADTAADLLQKIERQKSHARGQSRSALRNTKNNTGYRELPTTGKDLADLLRQVEQDAGKNSPARKRLSELITRATIASDECDFGTGLLLGLDVFTAGSCLEKEALQLLRVAYMLLRRANLYRVASGQCKHRNKDDLNEYIESVVASDQKSSNKQSKQSTVELPPPLADRK
ncbi:hypothetical protein JG688_00006448 [Phytophthora aleatoria]|uniref:Uncharacterized protein n=1 Tax=Phytophthora aleatoria TaxID=2496075 RepID=A0A8J5IYJ4_9STRA|nr:hypothetical protein JG688_00006448 [Phytophthora aleatoria]